MAMDTLAATQRSKPGGEDGSPPLFLAGIFLDFHMPNMSGVECVKSIRQVSGSLRLGCCVLFARRHTGVRLPARRVTKR